MNQNYTIKQQAVEACLEKILSKENFNQPDLREIMHYAVLNGGKRIRPVLLLAGYELFSDNYKKVMPFAAALELIHSYSLVHDDLPSMDNDDLRRGKPTCHKKFSEYGAILAGDALLTMAFEIMLKNSENFDNYLSIRAMKIIAEAAGANGMCAGQMTDMGNNVDDFEKLVQMHQNKTGALINAAVRAGAVLGGAKETEIKSLSMYADNIGLMFQIKDDILDVTSNTQTLGKAVLSDQKNQKVTFITEFGLEKCNNLLNEYLDKAVCSLDNIENSGFLKEIAFYIASRNN